MDRSLGRYGGGVVIMTELLNPDYEFPESLEGLPDLPDISLRGTPPNCFVMSPHYKSDFALGWHDKCFGCPFSSRPF